MIWCLHGAVGQASDWDAFSSALAAEGHPCRGVELWRFLECEGIGLSQWAAAFNAEVRAAGGEENVLIGYSMGGRLAFHALLDDPPLWQKAVIVSAHPGLIDEVERLHRMADDAEWAAAALTSDWKIFLEKWDAQGVLRGPVERPDPDPRMRLVNRRRAIARSFMEWSLGKQDNLRDRFFEISCPLLWLTGQGDEKFTSLACESIDLLPSGHHRILPGGHRLPWENPDQFLQEVRTMLRT